MESDTESQGTYATEGSFEVEDFSPPESPGAEFGVVEDHGGHEPYQFEPLTPAPVMPEAGTLGAEAMEGQERMGAVSEWCTCGHCTRLSPIENVCCQEVPKVKCRCDQIGGVSCITAHPGFEPVALNPYVLQALYGTYLQLFGELQEPVLNSCYRHLAYRNIVRWCWGYLGQHVHVVIPSCVVARIREEFPEDGSYGGFLPPLDF